MARVKARVASLSGGDPQINHLPRLGVIGGHVGASGFFSAGPGHVAPISLLGRIERSESAQILHLVRVQEVAEHGGSIPDAPSPGQDLAPKSKGLDGLGAFQDLGRLPTREVIEVKRGSVRPSRPGKMLAIHAKTGEPRGGRDLAHRTDSWVVEVESPGPRTIGLFPGQAIADQAPGNHLGLRSELLG